MAEEYRAGQGTIIPTMFMGLGGVGSRIVDRIAGRASLLPNWESQLRPLTSFISIDTNELDQHKLIHVPEGSRINISGFDKQKVVENYRRSNDLQALQWLDKGYQPRAGVKPGAGQIRVESRLSFFFHSPEIRQRLEALVDNSLRPGITWRQQNPPKFYVYIFCTLAGGTGSGCFLSAAYLIDEIIRNHHWQSRVIGNLMLSTLMLDKVGPELHPDIHANTYAALKELEHLTKLDYKQVKDEGRTSDTFVYWYNENLKNIADVKKLPQVSSRPFFLSFMIDRPPHLTLTDVEATIADASFLQVFTPIIDNLAGELDNYEKRLEGLTRFPGKLRDVGLGYTQNFGACGAAAMLLPGLDFLEYCALRFASESIRSQITFGVNPDDAKDDRALALARLAVNYSDPKFLRMSDEAREEAINTSFLNSVREMARQDEREELLDGFWYQLVQSVDEGRITGADAQGQPVRGESILKAVERKLAEVRSELLNKISVKERAFVFHKEGLNQYVELVSRLSDDIRAARQVINEGIKGLITSASEGEVISDFKLDPISERYLVVTLLKEIEKTWIPEAQAQLEKAKARDINNPKVRERLEQELYRSLQEAASKGSFLSRIFNRDQAFFDARDEAQDYYRGVAAGARKTFDADVQLQQLRALSDYLKRRSRQYARLSTRMNRLVQELEGEADRYRQGQSAITPSLALRVEVLETLDEPGRRIWDLAYHDLFIAEGRYLNTFDRKLLALTITQELKPIVRKDGKIVEKSEEQTVTDLKRVLCELGRQRMKPAILGDRDNPGIDLLSGLELEARLILQKGKKEGESVTDDEIKDYRERKFRALEQMCGVFGRVKTAESRSLDDGVTVNRSRQVIQGIGDASSGKAAADFLDRLKSMLSGSGKQVKVDTWHDPRLIIVHDVELPIPLYYWQSIVGEIENSYLRVASEEKRSYNLHTDKDWEHTLANLNPNQSEMTVGWAIKSLAIGLVLRIFTYDKMVKMWVKRDRKGTLQLSPHLSGTLYEIGKLHQNEFLKQDIDKQFGDAEKAMEPGEKQKMRDSFIDFFEDLLRNINLRQVRGEMSREDFLDRSILKTLIEVLRQESGVTETSAPSDKLSYENVPA